MGVEKSAMIEYQEKGNGEEESWHYSFIQLTGPISPPPRENGDPGEKTGTPFVFSHLQVL